MVRFCNITIAYLPLPFFVSLTINAFANDTGTEPGREISLTERAKLTSGGSNGMHAMDGFATSHQRGTATVVLAL